MSCNRRRPCAPWQAHAPRVLTLLAGAALLAAMTVPLSATTSAPALTGTWRSAPDELPIATPFEESVWGKKATKIRTVEMAFSGPGRVTLTIARRVADARGRTVPGSASVETATLALDTVARQTPYRSDFATTVEHAERRYPDDPAGQWTLDDLRVTVSTFPDDAGKIEVRVDYPEGRGSFWETLRPAARPAKTGAARRT